MIMFLFQKYALKFFIEQMDILCYDLPVSGSHSTSNVIGYLTLWVALRSKRITGIDENGYAPPVH